VIAMALLLRDMGGISQRAALLCAAVLFGIAPFAVAQEMFTWTKFFTLGFILGGIHLYRAALLQNRPWLAGGSFLVFTAGALAHYLAFLVMIFFAMHFISAAFRYSWKWQVVVYPAAVCVLFVGTWFSYLIATFGLWMTITANSTLGGYGSGHPGPYGVPATTGVVFLGNLVTTVLPFSWRHELPGIGRAPRIAPTDTRVPPEARVNPAELDRKAEWLSSLANDPSSIIGMLGFAGTIGLALAAARKIKQHSSRSVPQPSAFKQRYALLTWKF
jgi:hypothetical protein